MKILVLSDMECEALWDYFDKSRLEGIDLILSGGDLKSEYLSFLATFFHGPVLYVHGNHDAGYLENPPGGCTCIDGKLYEYMGLRILGLGGSMRYKPGPFQYTESQMRLRAMKLWPQICRHRGFDLLLTHAPAYGQGDSAALPHTGFSTFLTLMDIYQPAYMVHGHVHLNYNPMAPRIRTYRNTAIVNAFERHVIEFPRRR